MRLSPSQNYHFGCLTHQLKCKFHSLSRGTISTAPRDPRPSVVIHDFLFGIQMKMGTPPAVCKAHMAELLYATTKAFTHICSGGSDDQLHDFATAACHTSGLLINITGRMNCCFATFHQLQ